MLLKGADEFLEVGLLGVFNENLKFLTSDYLSMIAVGSIAVGDPFVPGRTDKDILLLFEGSPKPHLEGAGDFLGDFSFDDGYRFTPMPREAFGKSDSRYAFSNRFRSKTLFGEDFVESAELPRTLDQHSLYTKGLRMVYRRLNSAILNSSFWSEGHIRDYFWNEFKQAFMYLAVMNYYNTQNYPSRRKDLVDSLKSPELCNMFNVLHSIDSKSKEEILSCAKGVISYIEPLQ